MQDIITICFKGFFMYRLFKSIPVYKKPIPQPEDFGLTGEIINDVFKDKEKREHNCFNGALVVTLCCAVFCFYKGNSDLAFWAFFGFLPIRGIFECYIYPERKDKVIELINEYYKAKEHWWTEECWRKDIEKMQDKGFWTNKKNDISIHKLANLFFANGYKIEEELGHLLLKKDGKNIVAFLFSSYLNSALEFDNSFTKKYLENNDEIWLISLKRTNRKLKDICEKNNIKLITTANLVNLARLYCLEPLNE